MADQAPSVIEECNKILQQPCPYKVPPLVYLNGHAICPCVGQALKAAYVIGYDHSKNGLVPEVGASAGTEDSIG